MAHAACGGWNERVVEISAPADLDTLMEKGEAMVANLVREMMARGLPKGAVIEVEFGLRRLAVAA